MKRNTPVRTAPSLPVSFSVAPVAGAGRPADTLVLFLTENLAGSLPPGFPHKPELERMVREVSRSAEFQGKDQQFCALHTWGKVPWEKVLLVGLGRVHDVTRPRLLRAAATAARKADKAGTRRLAIAFPSVASLNPGEQAQSIAEGVLLGVYSFDQYKVASAEKKSGGLRDVVVLANHRDLPSLRTAVRAGELLAQATNYARDIANQPGNVIYPARLAEEAVRLGRQYKMRVTVWNQTRLEKENFGGILAVGAGSEREPRFIQIEYGPRSASRRPVVLVGKAITFDSGGISIKPSDKMDEMKFDKCGGVAVLGAMRAIAALKLPVRVVGLIASAENMPSASSYRPGDIVRTYSGRTIEVLNTDAEGRIVLGDALAYAEKLQPQAVIDLATLTGACVIALGSHAAGLFSNNDRLTDRLRAAADATGERVWPFPLWDEYHDMIKSPVADIKNTGGRYGGAITAAAFLQKFIDKSPWAHLDIAGTAWTTDEKPWLARGGTAYGVRLLVELLRNWKPL